MEKDQLTYFLEQQGLKINNYCIRGTCIQIGFFVIIDDLKICYSLDNQEKQVIIAAIIRDKSRCNLANPFFPLVKFGEYCVECLDDSYSFTGLVDVFKGSPLTTEKSIIFYRKYLSVFVDETNRIFLPFSVFKQSISYLRKQCN